MTDRGDASPVVVVGAGLVGLLVSLTLAARGLRVLLLERGQQPPAAVDWNAELARLPLRHVALSPASRNLLTQVNAWPAAAAAYYDMHVWEELGSSHLEFAHPETRDGDTHAALGWVLDHDGLQGLLAQRAREHPRIELRMGCEITACGPGPHIAIARADGATEELQPQLLLAADGANSTVRRLLRVAARVTPTGHHALATLVATQRPHGAVARQRFLRDGPLALLPSPRADVVSIVWSAPPARIDALCELSDAEFAQALTRASEGVLGDVLDVGRRASFPVQQQLAATLAPAPGVLLVGDAARTLHPLAGQGVNLGFEDVARLLALQESGGLFERRAQLRFAAARRVRSQAMILAMSTLQRTYGYSGPFGNWFRNQGVNWLASSRLAQRMLIEQALGLSAVTYNSAV